MNLRSKLLSSLVVISACALNPRLPTSATAKNAKVVKTVISVGSEVNWRSSPYWRPEDNFDWPWHVVIAADNTVCPVFDHREVYEPNPNEYYACQINWRLWRPNL